MKWWMILAIVVGALACDRGPTMCIQECGMGRSHCQEGCGQNAQCLNGCNSTYDTCVRVCGGQKMSGEESKK